MRSKSHSGVLPISRTTLLLRRLRSQIESDTGHQLTYEDIAERIGQPKSTLWSWFNGDGEPSTEAILTLLELLPYAARHQILDSSGILRARPSLVHPRLAHNPSAVSHLKTLLLQTSGITLVRGERDDLVTFLVMALGHSFRHLSRKPCEVKGIDSHNPDWFVPVPGVQFLGNITAPAKLQEALKKAWIEIFSSDALLTIVNGFPVVEMRQTLRLVAQNRHLVLGEKVSPKTPLPPLGDTHPIHSITVSPDRSNHERIAVEVQYLSP